MSGPNVVLAPVPAVGPAVDGARPTGRRIAVRDGGRSTRVAARPRRRRRPRRARRDRPATPDRRVALAPPTARGPTPVPSGPIDARPGPARRPGLRPSAVGTADPRIELDEGEELVAGRRPVEEAFAARRPARRLLVVPERRAALEQLVLHATTLRIPVVEVEGGSLTALTGFDGHQGVALVVEPRRWATLDDVIAAARAASRAAVRARARLSRGPAERGHAPALAPRRAGVHGVLFPTRRSAPHQPRRDQGVGRRDRAPAPRAGRRPRRRRSWTSTVTASASSVRTRTRRSRSARSTSAARWRSSSAARGRASARASAVASITVARIPMRGHVGSLNASVAGSVLLFEAVAQRGLGTGADALDRRAPTRQRGDDDVGRARQRDARRPAADASAEVAGPEAPAAAAGSRLSTEASRRRVPRATRTRRPRRPRTTCCRRRRPSAAARARPQSDG